MTPSDTLAFKKAIQKHWQTKTDEEMAHAMPGKTVEQVRAMREELGLKGKESLKDYARRYLLEMTDPEKKEFMSKLPAELVWRMAEGSPATSGTLDVSTEPIRINISHQLETVYGKRIITQLPENSETVGLPERSGG